MGRECHLALRFKAEGHCSSKLLALTQQIAFDPSDLCATELELGALRNAEQHQPALPTGEGSPTASTPRATPPVGSTRASPESAGTMHGERRDREELARSRLPPAPQDRAAKHRGASTRPAFPARASVLRLPRSRRPPPALPAPPPIAESPDSRRPARPGFPSHADAGQPYSSPSRRFPLPQRRAPATPPSKKSVAPRRQGRSSGASASFIDFTLGGASG